MQEIRKFARPNLKKMAKNATFELKSPISGPKIRHYGPKFILDEIFYCIIFKIASCSIIMQRIRKFPRVNLEKMAKNTIFGLKRPYFGRKMPHFGPKRANKIFFEKSGSVTF